MISNHPVTAIPYPTMRKRSRLAPVRRWVFRTMLFSLLTCGIVNLCVGGRPWVLLVAAGEYLGYRLLLFRDTVEMTLPQRLSSLIASVGAVLLLTHWFGSGGLEIALPMTYFGAVLLCALLLLPGMRRGHIPLLPMLQLMAGALLVVILGPYGMNWPRLVLILSLLAIVIFACLRYRKPLAVEFRKRFCTR